MLNQCTKLITKFTYTFLSVTKNPGTFLWLLENCFNLYEFLEPQIKDVYCIIIGLKYLKVEKIWPVKKSALLKNA